MFSGTPCVLFQYAARSFPQLFEHSFLSETESWLVCISRKMNAKARYGLGLWIETMQSYLPREIPEKNASKAQVQVDSHGLKFLQLLHGLNATPTWKMHRGAMRISPAPT
jgi:hypothetical protein